jgi:hypothetical protein
MAKRTIKSVHRRTRFTPAQAEAAIKAVREANRDKKFPKITKITPEMTATGSGAIKFRIPTLELAATTAGARRGRKATTKSARKRAR